MRWIVLAMILIMIGCQEEDVYAPKPRMYPKVNYPTRSYEVFDEHYCDFTFERPKYSYAVQDNEFFGEEASHPCWFDLKIDTFNAEVNFSYYPISREKSLDALLADAFKLTSKHNSKADYIEENYVKNQYGSTGLIFKLDGPVASPIQFYMTDSTRHFVRGALYFNSKVNVDSIKPILDFVEDDIDHIISSFKWMDHE